MTKRIHPVRRVFEGIGVVIVAGGLIAGIAFGFAALTYRPQAGIQSAVPAGTATVNGQSYPHVILYLNSFPDSSGMFNGQPIHKSGNSSWPAYGPSNEFDIPAHALVTVKWNQYDSGGELNNPFFAYPHGIVGPLIVNGKPATSIPLDNVAHTFTVRPEPGVDPGFFVSVASPANGNNPGDSGTHQTVQFSFISGAKGLYRWNCEFPCGTSVAGFGGPMGDYGYMSGWINVT